jgi:sugar/nucleoside kinase (ribokinase family)
VFSLAASLFTDVRLVGVVGQDFPQEAVQLLRARNVDLEGLQWREGETFRWVGEYDFDMNVAHTLDTRLNVFETFHPTLPDAYRDSDLIFLGNIAPTLQLEVLRQVDKPRLTCLDTMNFWISGMKDALDRVVEHVDAVLINEGEIREYTGQYNVLEAATRLLERGPRYIVVKRGEYGAVLFTEDDVFMVPAFPTWEVRDTTGAGDSFAGGFVGSLDAVGAIDASAMRAAMVFGSVVASYTVEDFSINGLLRATPDGLAERYARLAEITRIDASVHFNPRDLVAEGVS